MLAIRCRVLRLNVNQYHSTQTLVPLHITEKWYRFAELSFLNRHDVRIQLSQTKNRLVVSPWYVTQRIGGNKDGRQCHCRHRMESTSARRTDKNCVFSVSYFHEGCSCVVASWWQRFAENKKQFLCGINGIDRFLFVKLCRETLYVECHRGDKRWTTIGNGDCQLTRDSWVPGPPNGDKISLRQSTQRMATIWRMLYLMFIPFPAKNGRLTTYNDSFMQENQYVLRICVVCPHFRVCWVEYVSWHQFQVHLRCGAQTVNYWQTSNANKTTKHMSGPCSLNVALTLTPTHSLSLVSICKTKLNRTENVLTLTTEHRTGEKSIKWKDPIIISCCGIVRCGRDDKKEDFQFLIFYCHTKW